MPIFRFHGATEDQVKEYFKIVGELVQITNADLDHFVFFCEQTTLIGNGYDKDAIYVTVDWIGRPLKQEPVAKHIQKYFGKHSKSVYVKFAEINTFLYLNGDQLA